MDYFELGTSRIRASRLALGTWAFSGAKIWGSNPEEDSVRTIHMALDHGVNLIDTADRYGSGAAEIILGRALKGRRDRAVVATKVYTDMLGYKDVVRCCEDSLRRLDTDYIDLYQIHWASREIPLEETFRAFEDLRRDGKVREIGVCNFGVQDAPRAAALGAVIDQLPYSLVWRVVEKDVLPACRAAGLPVWAYVPLGQGLLTGKVRTIEDVPLNRRETRLYSSSWGQGLHSDPGFEDKIFPLLDALRALAEESGCTMSALALAFLKQREGISAVLLGARNEKQLRQNIEAYGSEVSAETVEKAIALSEDLRLAEGDNADLWVSKEGGRMR